MLDLSNEEFKVGKFKGKTFEEVSNKEPGYNKWIISIPYARGQLGQYKKFLIHKMLTKRSKNKRGAGRSGEGSDQDESLIDNGRIHIENGDMTIEGTTKMQKTATGKKLLYGSISFEILDGDTFKILFKKHGYSNHIPYDIYASLESFKPVMRVKDGDRMVTFDASTYTGIVAYIHQNFKFDGDVEELPAFVRRGFPRFCENTDLEPYSLTYNTNLDQQIIKTRLGTCLYESLKPFQRTGVEFGISRHGKIILGDEMGLGKTLQALGVAAYYHADWPLLIVCPSSVRFQWRDEILYWLPHLVMEHNIYTIKSSKLFGLNLDVHKVVILSYDLFSRAHLSFGSFKSVICDESHYIKSRSSKRTTTLFPILRTAIRVILCSGTPSLNNPSELYHQIAPLFDKFATFYDFSTRYSYLRPFSYQNVNQFSGSRHVDELHLFLVNTVMIRRLKKNVQKELPEKIRTKIIINVMDEAVAKLAPLLDNALSSDHAGISQLFKMTYEAKREGVCEYMKTLITQGEKFIIFAHHVAMLDFLEEEVMLSHVEYIRIDGCTCPSRREELVKHFQYDQRCKVAILSLTACGQGLNLTAASTVVITELYWVPGMLFQAEDRAHRIGTKGHTKIYYLIAPNTLDDVIWRMVNRKWGDVTRTLDGKKEGIIVDD